MIKRFGDFIQSSASWAKHQPKLKALRSVERSARTYQYYIETLGLKSFDLGLLDVVRRVPGLEKLCLTKDDFQQYFPGFSAPEGDTETRAVFYVPDASKYGTVKLTGL